MAAHAAALIIAKRLGLSWDHVIRALTDRVKEHGIIAHRLYGADGQIMVIDECPDTESFQRFFERSAARSSL